MPIQESDTYILITTSFDFTIIIYLFQEYYICHWRAKKYFEPKQHVKITEQANRFRNAKVNIYLEQADRFRNAQVNIYLEQADRFRNAQVNIYLEHADRFKNAQVNIYLEQAECPGKFMGLK